MVWKMGPLSFPGPPQHTRHLLQDLQASPDWNLTFPFLAVQKIYHHPHSLEHYYKKTFDYDKEKDFTCFLCKLIPNT